MDYQIGQSSRRRRSTWRTAAGASPGRATDRSCSCVMALPGERVLARITEVTTRLARAEAVQVLAVAGIGSRTPPCRHAVPGGCGGCDWQHAALPAQRLLKAAVIRQQLRRMAVMAYHGGSPPGDEAGNEPGDEPVRRDEPGLGWRTWVQFAVREETVAGCARTDSIEPSTRGRPIAHRAITDLSSPVSGGPGTLSSSAGRHRIGGTEP